MTKYNYKYNFNRPYPIFAEGGGAGGGGGTMNTRGMMDQQRKEKKVNHTTGTFLMDAGKWMLNQAVTPIETIAGREIYEPEFNYSGWDKADAVTSGIASAATDIVGTYFGGPFYGMAKKATSSTLDKVDPENKLSYRPGEAQVTEHGGEVSYQIGKRKYKTRGSVSNRTAGNVRKFNDGGDPNFQAFLTRTGKDNPNWIQNMFGGIANNENATGLLGGNTGNASTDGFMSMLTGGSSTDAAASGNSGGELMANLTGSLGGNENLQGIMGTYGKASTKTNPSELTRDVMNEGMSREWSGLDGGLISTWTDKTPNQVNALAAFDKKKDQVNAFANSEGEQTMKYYGSDGGGPGGLSVTNFGNDMNNASVDWANSRTAVGDDTWNKVGNTIAKVGNLASNYVGGGGAPGGDGSAMFSGGGGSNSFFSGMGGSSSGGFDMSSMMGGGGGGQGGGGGMNIDPSAIMKMFGNSGGARDGGNIKAQTGSGPNEPVITEEWFTPNVEVVKNPMNTTTTTTTEGEKIIYTPPVTTSEGDEAYALLTDAEKKKQDEKYIAAHTTTEPLSKTDVQVAPYTPPQRELKSRYEIAPVEVRGNTHTTLNIDGEKVLKKNEEMADWYASQGYTRHPITGTYIRQSTTGEGKVYDPNMWESTHGSQMSTKPDFDYSNVDYGNVGFQTFQTAAERDKWYSYQEALNKQTRDGGNIKFNDMRTKLYNQGTDVQKGANLQNPNYSTASTLPNGVEWDGQQYNVNPAFNGTFNIDEGNTHEKGGTYMNVPAEGEGNTTIEAEKGEVADVENGETYVWSKNKVPGTSLTFAKRKNNRDKKAANIESELEAMGTSNVDEYRKNTLLRQLLNLETEENSDKELQANIKRRNELNDRIKLDELLLSGRAIAKNGTYIKNGKKRKLTAFQESIYDNAIMRMGTEVKYENEDDVKTDPKPKRPKRPFGNPADFTYQRKMRDYKKAMIKYQAELKTWNASQSNINEAAQENIQETKDVFDVVQNPDTKEWEYKVNGEVVDAETYDKAIADWEANPTASNPLVKDNNFSTEKNQIIRDDQGNIIDLGNNELQNPDDLNNSMGDLVPTYNAEGHLTGWKAPEETQDTPGNVPPIEPITPLPIQQPNLINPNNVLPPPAQVNEEVMQDFNNQVKANQEQTDRERKAAAKGYDVNEEDLVYNDEGMLVPEKGTKNKTDGDTWGDNGWNDDAPEVAEIAAEQRQQEIINNRNAALSGENIEEKDPNYGVRPTVETNPTNIPYKSLDNVVVANNNNNTTANNNNNTTEGEAANNTEGGGGEEEVVTANNKKEEVVVEEEVVEEEDDVVEEEVIEEEIVEDDVVEDKVENNQEKNAVNTSGWKHQNVMFPGFMKSPYDWLGDAGLIYGAQAGIGNTKKFWDEYQGLPNENFWEGVGDRRERRLNNNLGVIDASRKNTKRDLRQDLNQILRGNRNTASSFGNLNARDQNAFNTYAENSINSDLKYGLMGLDQQGKIADAEWDTDKLRHKGDWAVRERDQEDLSGYYTQLGADKQNIAKNMMELAKNKNTGYSSLLQGNALNSMGGFKFDKNGNIVPNNTTNNITNNYHFNPDSKKWELCPGGNCGKEVDPNAVNPNEVDPNAVDPNAVDPNAVDPNAVVENTNTETIVNQQKPLQTSGYFKTTNEVGGLKKHSGDYSPINEDGSLNTGHYQEWLNIHKDPTGKKLSRLTQSGGQGNTTTYSDKSGVNAKPADWDEATQGPWTQPFPGRDNTVGRNVKTTADWYGEDYLRHLIETGHYNPEAVQGEQGYTSGLLTGKGSGTYQIPLNPDSKSMVSTTTFEGGEDLDPTTWNQTQKDAWLLANPDATIEDAITKYNPESVPTDSIPSKRYGGAVNKRYNFGGLAQMIGGGQGGGGGFDLSSIIGGGQGGGGGGGMNIDPSMIMGMMGGGMKNGTGVKRYDEGDGGLVEYFKSERDKNRKNNRNLADQRIAEFQNFMKNRK